MTVVSKGPVVVGVGNPLVDVLAQTGPEAVARHGLTAGGMHLIEAEAAAGLYKEIGPGVRQAGGSVANTVAHLAGEPVAARFVGKLGTDDLGDVFAGEFEALDIGFETPRHATVGTGRCMVMITPDGERTMSTFLGAAQHLGPEDVVQSMPESCDMVFIEGYLWDSPEGAAVVAEAAARARKAGAQVAMTPSDAGCVERNAAAMRDFIAESCDVIVGNADEMCALADVESAQAALRWARGHVGTAAVTLSENGCLVSDMVGTAALPAEPIADVVDTTGAGDAYAAGLLGELANGSSVARAAERATELGARVVQHTGARQAAPDRGAA
ncbi:aminoimidazole riboside kinase [Roseivivax jejudonensis]|uniref:Aminoimidazole riboside kinase n=1 Tax=Roseivivax jejudonensis TaxID=1529041 RepID=A0A1X6Y6V8_9RHOB|nr:adenosine kinase [Roseivivax jejudonensis]SLN12487.1 aminoimidazole riboside kinase [Roseivivax jejudonensis]